MYVTHGFLERQKAGMSCHVPRAFPLGRGTKQEGVLQVIHEACTRSSANSEQSLCMANLSPCVYCSLSTSLVCQEQFTK